MTPRDIVPGGWRARNASRRDVQPEPWLSRALLQHEKPSGRIRAMRTGPAPRLLRRQVEAEQMDVRVYLRPVKWVSLGILRVIEQSRECGIDLAIGAPLPERALRVHD